MDTETANAQDARVDALWATLDTRNQGHLDLAALKKGLRKLDHRTLLPCLPTARPLTGTSAEKRGSDPGGRDEVGGLEWRRTHIVQWSDARTRQEIAVLMLTFRAEFRTFVQETERELLALFKSIDSDRNGKISRGELQVAFSRAGLAVPNSKLDVFFSEVDANNDGAISFEEWRYVVTGSEAQRPPAHSTLVDRGLHFHHTTPNHTR